jgi:16S rRNA (guanine1516-N2)-methyltransferase
MEPDPPNTVKPCVPIAVAVDGDGPSVLARAEAMAAMASLPLVIRSEWCRYTLLLTATDQRCELREAGPHRSRPIYVDFLGGHLGRRRKNVVGAERMLAKAVGFKGKTLHVVDATAGLGRDAFLLACMGCRVTIFERSPVMAALLLDGIWRTCGVPKVGEIVAQSMQLLPLDARPMLLEAGKALRADVVYLDPMFPARGKSALAKKEMRICRLVAGDDEDASELLQIALGAARKRVVVKRPLKAPPLGGEPSIVYKGTTIRYDVYLTTPARAPRT